MLETRETIARLSRIQALKLEATERRAFSPPNHRATCLPSTPRLRSIRPLQIIPDAGSGHRLRLDKDPLQVHLERRRIGRKPQALGLADFSGLDQTVEIFVE